MWIAASRLDFCTDRILNVENAAIARSMKTVDILVNFISNPIRLALVFKIDLPFLMLQDKTRKSRYQMKNLC